jgi:hypothetical protein
MCVTVRGIILGKWQVEKRLTAHIALTPNTALIMCNARCWFTIPVPSVPKPMYLADIYGFNFWHAIC